MTTLVPLAGDTLLIVKGDDYLNADGRALDWADSAWPSIAGGTVALRMVDAAGDTFAKAGTVVSATEAHVELAAADTAALELGNWLYTLHATLADGHVVTLATGVASVVDELPAAASPDEIDYVTLDMIKNSRTLTSQSFADDDIRLSITAASRLVDDETHRYFGLGPTGEVRYYTASRRGDIEIDDLVTLTEFATDPTGFGDYTDIWVNPDDILLDPPNAPLKSAPYERVIVRRRVPYAGWGGYIGAAGWYGFGKFRWPFRFPQAVRVTGQFGWPQVPAKVQEAVMILAPRLILRKREAPWAIVGLGNDSPGMRLSKTDPDVCALLSRYTRDQYFAGR